MNRVTITSGQSPRSGVGRLHTSQTLVGMQSFILPSTGSGVPASPTSPLGTISGGGLGGGGGTSFHWSFFHYESTLNSFRENRHK